jgi:hypothetical protein
MAEAALSSGEHVLENQRIGGLQIRVAVLCTLVQICDGSVRLPRWRSATS